MGTFMLPTSKGPSGIHQYLTSLITESSTFASEEEVISHIMAQLPSALQDRGLSVQLFSFPVLSDSPDALLTGSPIPVWKWAKPKSFYGRKTGFWEVDLSRAVEDGEWSAGKQLLILVKGVSQEKGEDLKKRKVIYEC